MSPLLLLLTGSLVAHPPTSISYIQLTPTCVHLEPAPLLGRTTLRLLLYQLHHRQWPQSGPILLQKEPVHPRRQQVLQRRTFTPLKCARHPATQPTFTGMVGYREPTHRHAISQSTTYSYTTNRAHIVTLSTRCFNTTH
ncbi:hypothetical protein DEU56DRAFT_779276 [Suillus clintonianus]|uniref:uncharacterized protein n=1 Tax=Suillus clintonianus TaxID=1904413 RepID=UPI001B883E74|nr:uncharacterized protein DEU56DRAFT_779276 [Suillus clintonianus]KAG2150948.1 hypothetical protein DEU56DRAFT_779276 [Suillus clintonianus]